MPPLKCLFPPCGHTLRIAITSISSEMICPKVAHKSTSVYATLRSVCLKHYNLAMTNYMPLCCKLIKHVLSLGGSGPINILYLVGLGVNGPKISLSQQMF